MKKYLITFFILLFSLSSTAFADTIEVPIVVNGDTYTIGPDVVVPTSGDYYYVYSGHRCYSSEQTTTYTSKGTVITTKSGPQLYCYPNP